MLCGVQITVEQFEELNARNQSLGAEVKMTREIADVVRAVAAGRTLLDERTVTRHKAASDDPTERLTPSENKVLELIGEGLSNREIGERLGVAEKTVKNHITSLLAKMGLQRRTQVAAWVAARKNSGWRNG